MIPPTCSVFLPFSLLWLLAVLAFASQCVPFCCDLPNESQRSIILGETFFKDGTPIPIYTRLQLARRIFDEVGKPWTFSGTSCTFGLSDASCRVLLRRVAFSCVVSRSVASCRVSAARKRVGRRLALSIVMQGGGT